MLPSPMYVHGCDIAHLTSSLTNNPYLPYLVYTDIDSRVRKMKASLEASEREEFAKGLPQGLLVPSNQIQLLNNEAIGQGTV